MTEAHNPLYLPWVSPDLTSISPDLHAAVQKHLMVLVQAASVAHVRSRRRYSESTTHSSEEEGMLPWKSSYGTSYIFDFLSFAYRFFSRGYYEESEGQGRIILGTLV